jgi:mRNA-degrading endonuclease RelE of RelBE toxin-antitoxin system
MEGGELTPRYTVKLNKRARQGLSRLPAKQQREAERLLTEFLPTTPIERVPGKVKKLRGAYERLGYLQYDLPDGYRIWYQVEQTSMTVYVVYIGPHP